MCDSEAEALAREFYAAYADKDAARLTRVCSDDCVIVMPTLERMDLPAYAAMLGRQWSGAITDESIDVRDVLSKADKAVVEWTYRGTLKQEIAGLAATGKTYEVPISTVMEMRNGRIAEARIYLNWALLT